MKTRTIAVVFASGVLAGCMAGGIPAPAQTGSSSTERPAAGGSSSRSAVVVGTPLLIDRTDLRLGTTVQFNRIPTVKELADLGNVPALAHLVLALPEWPPDFAPLQPLDQLPYRAEIVVVLAGWPPTHGAAQVWNYVNATLRIVVVAPGPPPNADVINDLNAMTDLERVVVEMDYPSRSGLERLHRPLSFRKVVD